MSLSPRQTNQATMVLEEPLFDLSPCNTFLIGLLEELEKEGNTQNEGSHKHESISKPKSKATLNPTKALVQRRDYDPERLWSITIDPQKLGLVPADEWPDNKQVTLNELVANHFRARSTRRLRFEHKLWNALRLVNEYPELRDIMGIQWQTNDIIRVDRDKFGLLLGLTRPTAALFNPQGSFQSHGFVEVNMKHVATENPTTRYFTHKSGAFTKDSQSADLLSCRWQTKPNPIDVDHGTHE